MASSQLELVLLSSTFADAKKQRKITLIGNDFWCRATKLASPVTTCTRVTEEREGTNERYEAIVGSVLTMLKSFLGTGAATRPVPRGAGIRRTRTEPHLPVTCMDKNNGPKHEIRCGQPGEHASTEGLESVCVTYKTHTETAQH